MRSRQVGPRRRQRLLQIVGCQRGQRLSCGADGALRSRLLGFVLRQGGLQRVDPRRQRAAFFRGLPRQVRMPALRLALAVKIASDLVERLVAGRTLLFVLHLRLLQLVLAVERGLALLFCLAHLRLRLAAARLQRLDRRG